MKANILAKLATMNQGYCGCGDRFAAGEEV